MLTTSSLIPIEPMWDPNTWEEPCHEHRIYAPMANGREPWADECLAVYAIVDPIDYAWATQWGWRKLYSRGKNKFYLSRAVTVTIGERWTDERTGKRIQNRRTENLMLHSGIMDRMGIPRPTPKHFVGHLDDESMNCRRVNLAWITPKENMQMSERTKASARALMFKLRAQGYRGNEVGSRTKKAPA